MSGVHPMEPEERAIDCFERARMRKEADTFPVFDLMDGESRYHFITRMEILRDIAEKHRRQMSHFWEHEKERRRLNRERMARGESPEYVPSTPPADILEDYVEEQEAPASDPAEPMDTEEEDGFAMWVEEPIPPEIIGLVSDSEDEPMEDAEVVVISDDDEEEMVAVSGLSSEDDWEEDGSSDADFDPASYRQRTDYLDRFYI